MRGLRILMGMHSSLLSSKAFHLNQFIVHEGRAVPFFTSPKARADDEHLLQNIQVAMPTLVASIYRKEGKK